MTRHLPQILNLLRLLPRAVLLTLVISAPVLAMPGIRGSEQNIIEAPTNRATGAGFVLMVSLQRA